MKTLPDMLRELLRPEVVEFAIASDRLPCVKIGGKYEPIGEKSRTAESILAMLVAIGGSRYVEDLETRPTAWAARVEGVGVVGVHALMRQGRVQARFVLTRRAPGALPGGPPAQAPETAEPFPAEPPPPEASLVEPPPAEPSPALLESVSESLLRAAAAKPEVARPTGLAGLDALLVYARDARASDLHIVAGRPMMLRVGGELAPRGTPVDAASVEEMIAPVVPERLRAELVEHGSVDFALDRESIGRFRANVARQRTGLKACFRCIPSGVPTLASLGLPPEISRATRHHQGLVLITGPTGHGKTSTLAAIIDIINSETTHHVITVEDPVEYIHPRKKAVISQREIGSHTRSFASALKASLREDPDVIVVGELRDTETVRMALAASETGHLVLGTMNTPNAAKTIDRLVDLFPAGDQPQVRMTLAGGLHLVVSQRLLTTADGQRMAAAVELLPGSVALWSMIRDNKTYQIPSLQQRGKGAGIVRLDEAIADLVRAGRVSREAAVAAADNPEELDAVLSGKRAPIAQPLAQGAQAAPQTGPAAPGAPPKPEASTGLLGRAGQLFGKRGG